MTRFKSNKVWYLFISIFLHLMIANVFAFPTQSFSSRILPVARFISVQLDLQSKQELTAPKVIPQQVEKPKAVSSKPAPRIETNDQKSETYLNQLDSKRAELDQRIKAIREKLKRTVKSQQLKRAANTQKGFQILSADRQGPEWETYLNQIREQVLSKWYPKLVGAESLLVKSEAQLNFEIFLDGRIKNFEVVNSKGSEEFKRISLQAFKESMPFQPYTGAVTPQKRSKSYLLTLFFYYQ